MSQAISIVNRGRGPQLSTSRITVQDLVPYFQRDYTREQILEVMPALSLAELEVIERYVQDHYQEILDQDRRIRERNALRETPPEIEEVLHRAGERMSALREEFKKNPRRRRNGDQAAG